MKLQTIEQQKKKEKKTNRKKSHQHNWINSQVFESVVLGVLENRNDEQKIAPDLNA